MITTIDIPQGWQKIRLKRIASLNPPKSEVTNFPDDTAVTFLPMEAVSESWVVDYSRTRPLAEVCNGYTYFRDGDILIAKITPCFENGKGALVNGCLNGFGFGTTEFHVIRSPNSETARFLSYVVRSYRFKVEGAGMMTGTAGQKRLSDDYVKDFEVFLPSLLEREKIAHFLDRKTAAIDTLIAKKQHLIQLLEEKRTALINEAVTKGMNPNVPMKDSGIPWIGEIPEHWSVSKPKFLTKRIVDGTHHTPSYVERGIPFLTVKNLTAGEGISFEDVKYVTAEAHSELSKRAKPEIGDLLVTKDGTLGVTRVIEDERAFSIFVSLALIKPFHSEINSYFFKYVLESKTVFDQFQARKLGSALQHIHLVELSNIFIPLPPIKEQGEMAAEIKAKIDHCQKIEERVFSQIEKLQEYRRSLITAAVTGKLDISEVEPDV
ncbi:MAG: restriction endonuclease subunit S [Oculatellaceae cyanobacterium Prado106]|jgi:restriction endonuclease S subunit|nr:restriction endonuclease subunit S [Oculatellaceae cyanobacterium Prado106]